MKILIVAATEGEISIVRDHLQTAANPDNEVNILVTGVGAIATTYALTRELDVHKYDFVLQAGVAVIAGACRPPCAAAISKAPLVKIVFSSCTRCRQKASETVGE